MLCQAVRALALEDQAELSGQRCKDGPKTLNPKPEAHSPLALIILITQITASTSTPTPTLHTPALRNSAGLLGLRSASGFSFRNVSLSDHDKLTV